MNRNATVRTDLASRVLTALGIGVVVLGVIILGRQLGLAILVSLVSGFASAEFYGLLRSEHRRPNELFGVVAACAMPLAALFLGERGLVAVVAALVLAALTWRLLFRQVDTSDTASTVFGALYAGFTLSFLVLLRALPDVGSAGIASQGEVIVLVTFLSVWANDVFAYLVGVAVGRHRMMPAVSPHKSWEGFLGGAVASLLLWVAAYSLSATPFGGTGLPLAWHVLLGLAVPVAATGGDLAESRFKREAGAKDSGRLLPGHGGFLDRFDSMIVVAVVVYYIVIFARAL